MQEQEVQEEMPKDVWKLYAVTLTVENPFVFCLLKLQSGIKNFNRRYRISFIAYQEVLFINSNSSWVQPSYTLINTCTLSAFTSTQFSQMPTGQLKA